MYYAFQDRENLYLVMDYLSGGDLRYHICRNRRFSEEITRKCVIHARSYIFKILILFDHLGFFVACLISGLEYFHKKNILHRDIKPENLVIETDGKLTHFSCFEIPYKDKPNLSCAPLCAVIGYLRITDFGIARMWREENAQDTSGTPGYMAPEVMCRQNHTTSVDFFAVGVIAYESMFGRVRDLVPK